MRHSEETIGLFGLITVALVVVAVPVLLWITRKFW
jgi:hypothetical protein